jgi:16S rRNA (adenine1518-N6/adenine1519-N6)-dimethyltransferase
MDLKHRPLKRFGQNFLIQPTVADKIISVLNISAGDCVIEIGPGTGVLTEGIIHKSPAKYFAIEIDRNLAAFLREKFIDKVTIFEQDFLEWDFSVVSTCDSVKVIGNIPYNITSPILFRLTDYHSKLDSAVIMMQKEVAKRVAAFPGNKDYGILSIMMQTYADITYLFEIAAANFKPMPQVDSAVVKFNFIRQPEGIDNPDLFKRIVRSVFNNRRKMLRNTLSRIFPKTVVSSLSLFDLTKRPEELSLSDFKALANKVNSLL